MDTTPGTVVAWAGPEVARRRPTWPLGFSAVAVAFAAIAFLLAATVRTVDTGGQLELSFGLAFLGGVSAVTGMVAAIEARSSRWVVTTTIVAIGAPILAGMAVFLAGTAAGLASN